MPYQCSNLKLRGHFSVWGIAASNAFTKALRSPSHASKLGENGQGKLWPAVAATPWQHVPPSQNASLPGHRALPGGAGVGARLGDCVGSGTGKGCVTMRSKMTTAISI